MKKSDKLSLMSSIDEFIKTSKINSGFSHNFFIKFNK